MINATILGLTIAWIIIALAFGFGLGFLAGYRTAISQTLDIHLIRQAVGQLQGGDKYGVDEKKRRTSKDRNTRS